MVLLTAAMDDKMPAVMDRGSMMLPVRGLSTTVKIHGSQVDHELGARRIAI